MTRDVQSEIKKLVTQNPVVLYMKGTPSFPMCGFSAAAVEVLEAIGAPFKSVNVLEDQDVREGVKQFADWPTIPQLFVGGEFVGGCDIMREMHAKGELAPLIAKATGGAK